jgi:hypothetical protein
MRGVYIHCFSSYTGEPNVNVQWLKGEISHYTRVNFRRGNRFILLTLLGACQCIHGRSIEADTAVYLTTEHGNLGETATVLDEIDTARSLPKPYGFINTMSGTAAFYLAQTLGLKGRNITVSSQHLSFERGLELLMLDFAGGAERSALIGGVDEASLSGENTGQGNHRHWRMADGSGWFYVKSGREGACGAFTANRSFRDAPSCIEWIRKRVGPPLDLLSFGALVGEDEATALKAALRPAAGFDYLHDRGYCGSATACGIGTFMGHFQGRSLLHINKDRRGNYALLEVERY